MDNVHQVRNVSFHIVIQVQGCEDKVRGNQKETTPHSIGGNDFPRFQHQSSRRTTLPWEFDGRH